MWSAASGSDGSDTAKANLSVLFLTVKPPGTGCQELTGELQSCLTHGHWDMECFQSPGQEGFTVRGTFGNIQPRSN